MMTKEVIPGAPIFSLYADEILKPRRTKGLGKALDNRRVGEVAGGAWDQDMFKIISPGKAISLTSQ